MQRLLKPHPLVLMCTSCMVSRLPAASPALMTSMLSWVVQMSAAWGELDESTAAVPPNIDSIKAAIRQARPYEELKQQVRVAENFLASLERGLERQHAQERAELAQPDRQRKAPEARAAGVPSPQSSPGRGKQSASRVGPVPESPHHVEAAQQSSESSQILDAIQMPSRERPSGQDSAAVERAAVIQQSHAAVTEAEQQEEHALSFGMSKGVEAHEAAEECTATEVYETADVHERFSEEERSGASPMPANAGGGDHPEEPANDSSTTAKSYSDW